MSYSNKTHFIPFNYKCIAIVDYLGSSRHCGFIVVFITKIYLLRFNCNENLRFMFHLFINA